MTDLYTIKGSHFGSLTEPAIRNVELCEDDYPKRCLQPREACEQSPARVQWRLLAQSKDSAQANSQGSFLRLFVLLCGMTLSVENISVFCHKK